MANLNRVMLIGRLTREVEMKTFASGGKVATFSFATNNRKKENGQWVDDPCFLDVKAFNREHGRKLADLAAETFQKGKQLYLEGHLVQESWTDKASGQKRSKLVIVLDDFQYLDAKGERSEGGRKEPEDYPDEPLPAGDGGEGIPF